MKCNVGGMDRKLRTIGGAGAIALGLFAPFSRRGRKAALAIGGIQLLTAATRYCPLNQLFRINSCRGKRMVNAPESVKLAEPVA